MLSLKFEVDWFKIPKIKVNIKSNFICVFATSNLIDFFSCTALTVKYNSYQPHHRVSFQYRISRRIKITNYNTLFLQFYVIFNRVAYYKKKDALTNS